jgi:PRTRC genetic system ThiF family protein
METHKLHEELLNREVRLLVVGCGGTGTSIMGGLPYIHQAMLVQGHPYGLHVTVMDADTVSPFNCVRQPFSRGEIGLYKGVVMVNRINLFWGLNWKAIPRALTAQTLATSYAGSGEATLRPDIVVGCVDTRAARAIIAKSTEGVSAAGYWLDLGNSHSSGQFVLGEPQNARNKRSRTRLRTVAELYPEIVDPALDDDNEPSCSAIEALERQECFVNTVLASTPWHCSLACSGTARSPIIAASWTSRLRGQCRSRLIRCAGAGSENGPRPVGGGEERLGAS